jgi:adenylate cyclase
VKQVGRELGVRYVLEGSVRKVGSRVRITGQLIEATTGAHLWADRFDGDLSDIFELQDEVTHKVVGAIEPSLRNAEIERTRAKPTGNLDAYDLYLQGQFQLTDLSRERYEEAAHLFRQASRLDPNYSDALAALVDCVGRSYAMGWADDYPSVSTEVCRAARHAITADPENATALAAAGWGLALFGGHFDEALELAAKAIKLHPNSAFVRAQVGFVHVYAGESDEAVVHFNAARRLNPVDPRGFMYFVGLGQAHLLARRFEDAENACRRGIAHMPRNTPSRRILASALAHLGRMDEARVVATELLALQPGATLSFSRRFPRFRHEWMTDLFVEGLRLAGLTQIGISSSDDPNRRYGDGAHLCFRDDLVRVGASHGGKRLRVFASHALSRALPDHLIGRRRLILGPEAKDLRTQHAFVHLGRFDIDAVLVVR